MEAHPNPSVGILLEIVLDVVGLDDAPHFKLIPVAVIERPLDVPRLQEFVNPILASRPEPEAPLSLSHFADIISNFLAQEADVLDSISDLVDLF